jgi:hypothetical protein
LRQIARKRLAGMIPHDKPPNDHKPFMGVPEVTMTTLLQSDLRAILNEIRALCLQPGWKKEYPSRRDQILALSVKAEEAVLNAFLHQKRELPSNNETEKK